MTSMNILLIFSHKLSSFESIRFLSISKANIPLIREYPERRNEGLRIELTMSLFILGYSLAYILDGELDSPLRGLKLGSIFILSPSPVSLFQISFSFISLDYFLYLNILSFYIGLLFWIITRGRIRDYMIWEFGRNIYSWCLRDF